MNPLVIRTGAPFGYLFAYLIVMGGLIIGLALFATGLRRRHRGRAAMGAIVIAFLVYVVVVNIDEEDALDMNPVVRDATVLAGYWTGSHDVRLMLAADGSYRCVGYGECLRTTNTGTWDIRTGSHDIELHPSGSAVPNVVYTVVRYRGQLRLAHQIDDPDVWDGKMPFQFVPPSA